MATTSSSDLRALVHGQHAGCQSRDGEALIGGRDLSARGWSLLPEDAEMGALRVELERPADLDMESWEAVTDQVGRLNRALEAGDLPLVIGCAKELVESVARIVLSSRGEAAASMTDYASVVSAAHKVLEYQPGLGLAMNAPVRGIASSAKKIAVYLRDLRNDYGTGHGRATKPLVEEEAALMAVEASVLWVRWALGRLEHLLAGKLAPLLDHLNGWSTMSRNEWRSKLVAANISALPEPDQKRLGAAVGRRAAADTFVVREVGMEEPLADPNTEAWPPAYRRGAVEGAFINATGQLDMRTAAVVRPAAALAASLPDSAEFLRELGSKIESASWSPAMARTWHDVSNAMRMSAGEFGDGSARQEWERIIGIIEAMGAPLGEE